jgi:hypothetical protein
MEASVIGLAKLSLGRCQKLFVRVDEFTRQFTRQTSESHRLLNPAILARASSSTAPSLVTGQRLGALKLDPPFIKTSNIVSL